MKPDAASASPLPGEPAAVPASFASLFASLLGAIFAVVIASGWPVPIHKVRYSMQPPATGPVRYHHLWISPDQTLWFDGREVSMTALVVAVGRADAAAPETAYYLGVHPEARWETVLETMALLRRTTMADIRLPHTHAYDSDL
ncbi:MAG TPA: hypothetical protein VF702_00275 [Allosphingosinicella sp.]|jgi:hypothetical protein